MNQRKTEVIKLILDKIHTSEQRKSQLERDNT